MVIQLKNISYQRQNKVILKNIDWIVQKGEHWALLGLNGSGKTTLLNIINGYIWPTTGEVTVLSKQFGAYPLGELRKLIGWVSTSMQEKLYGNEYTENIVLSGKFASPKLYEDPEQTDIDRALNLMEEFGLSSFIHRRYATLSQGEKQKVLILRALMANPKLLILDEPCTGLDVFAREHLLETVDQLSKQNDAPTLIYVTHHIEEILPVFQKTLMLRRGKIYQAGITADLLTEEQLTEFFEAPLPERATFLRQFVRS
ncbi:ABC transporter ATP-binding protein [Pueribacillus sp. YX66]|uniref:ABC transporter ATP-binding protein n=1 Tax=Pueribacillus sp. YX66 TaxID=3229242 RepID=UPI00358D670E